MVNPEINFVKLKNICDEHENIESITISENINNRRLSCIKIVNKQKVTLTVYENIISDDKSSLISFMTNNSNTLIGDTVNFDTSPVNVTNELINEISTYFINALTKLIN